MITDISEVTVERVRSDRRAGLDFDDPATGRGAIIKACGNRYEVDLFEADDAFIKYRSTRSIRTVRRILRDWTAPTTRPHARTETT